MSVQDQKKSRWLIFAQCMEAGCYKDFDVFTGIAEMIMKVEERRFKGKKLTNMKYDASWDQVCTMLALTSPRAYKILTGELGGGRSLRSMT
jgi:hypothetical protein